MTIEHKAEAADICLKAAQADLRQKLWQDACNQKQHRALEKQLCVASACMHAAILCYTKKSKELVPVKARTCASQCMHPLLISRASK